LPLSESTEIIEKKPYPIHLFEFTAKSIKKLILGAKISQKNMETIKYLMKDKKFSHVDLYRAHLDSSSYGILIQKEK